jgi:hypothetical protein
VSVQHKRRAGGLTRPRSRQVTQRAAGLLPRRQQRKAEPPCWSSRSLWADLPFVEPPRVNQTRVLRLMRAPDLLVTPHLQRHAQRTPTRSQPSSFRKCA